MRERSGFSGSAGEEIIAIDVVKVVIVTAIVLDAIVVDLIWKHVLEVRRRVEPVKRLDLPRPEVVRRVLATQDVGGVVQDHRPRDVASEPGGPIVPGEGDTGGA